MSLLISSRMFFTFFAFGDDSPCERQNATADTGETCATESYAALAMTKTVGEQLPSTTDDAWPHVRHDKALYQCLHPGTKRERTRIGWDTMSKRDV